MYLARTSKLGDCGVYLGGVLDGHDTHQASEFCSQNFPPLLFKSIVDKPGAIQRSRRAAAGRAKLRALEVDLLAACMLRRNLYQFRMRLGCVQDASRMRWELGMRRNFQFRQNFAIWPQFSNNSAMLEIECLVKQCKTLVT